MFIYKHICSKHTKHATIHKNHTIKNDNYDNEKQANPSELGLFIGFPILNFFSTLFQMIINYWLDILIVS